MMILALDTATDKGSLALVAGEHVVGEWSLESQGTYLTRLLPGIQGLLQETGRRLGELAAIAVSSGPGNFTGLRIGLATAKTLAWSLGLPLVPVSTLEVLAAQFPHQPQPVGVILDAKRQEVFWGLFRCPADQPQWLEGPLRLPAADLPARLAAPLILTGPGLNSYGDLFPRRGSPGLFLAPEDMRHPRASILARLARPRLARGETAVPEKLVPTYLRPAL